VPTARCSCGALTAEIAAGDPVVVACHCIACQRRSGSPFGVAAYYPAAVVTVAGEAREFERGADSGGRFRSYFCPTCGSTVFWKTDKHPDRLGIAVGAIADPHFPGPIRSVWEQSKHDWVRLDVAAQHLDRGR